MTEFTTPPSDAIRIVGIRDKEILFNYGNFDERCVVVKYPKQVGKSRTKTVYWPIYDFELYRNYISLTTQTYPVHQKEWDSIVFDIFNVEPVLNETIYEETEDEITASIEINKEFIHETKNVFERYTWTKSVFYHGVNNYFSKVWNWGIDNIKATLIIARLIGEARDYLYQNYGDPSDAPISACIGRHGTKDCLYKINKGRYPDFYRVKRYGFEGPYETNELDWTHYNISKIVTNENIPESGPERINFIEEYWASKLKNWYKKFLETKAVAKDRIDKSAKRTIYESLLSNKDKQKEIDKLDKY